MIVGLPAQTVNERGKNPQMGANEREGLSPIHCCAIDIKHSEQKSRFKNGK